MDDPDPVVPDPFDWLPFVIEFVPEVEPKPLLEPKPVPEELFAPFRFC